MDLLGLDSNSSSDSEYYVDPTSSSYRPPTADERAPPRDLDLSSTTQQQQRSSDLNSSARSTPTSKGSSLGISTPSSNGPSSSSSFDFLSDPFGPSPQQPVNQQTLSFANFDNFNEGPAQAPPPPPSSSHTVCIPPPPAPATVLSGEDKYAALKDLDSLFKTGASDSWNNTTNTGGVASSSSSTNTGSTWPASSNSSTNTGSTWPASSSSSTNTGASWPASSSAFGTPWGTATATQHNTSNPFSVQAAPPASSILSNSWSKPALNGSPFGLPQAPPQQQHNNMPWGAMSTSHSINFPPTNRNWNNPNPFLPSTASSGNHSSNPFL